MIAKNIYKNHRLFDTHGKTHGKITITRNHNNEMRYFEKEKKLRH